MTDANTHPTPDYDEVWAQLTPKQQAFVEGIASGKTQTAAYKAAYDTAPGRCERSIAVNASREANKAKVALCIEMSRTKAIDFTRRAHDTALARIALKAENEGKYGAAITALQTMGKAAGLYVDRVEDVTERDPRETLATIAEKSPDLASILAQRYNLDYRAPKQPTVNDAGTA